MRVIAGTARRTPLQTVDGLSTRPTTDRIKETLFNMLSFSVADTSFLDLFAGSGAIGIEALSRGAADACFAENNPKACRCIDENLKRTKLDGKAQLLRTDVCDAIRRLHGRGRQFHIIFMDPPYHADIESEVLQTLMKYPVFAENTRIIIEALSEKDFSFVRPLGYDIVKEKYYKTNKHVFLTVQEGKLC